MTNHTTYVLDTSVLLSVGVRALYSFKNADLVIPIVVIRELESKRNDPVIGFMARETLREIENLRETQGNNLREPVDIAEGVTLRVELNHVSQAALPDVVKNHHNDTRILAVAVNLRDELKDSGGKVVLISNDLPLRLIAQIGCTLQAEEFVLPELNQGDFSGVYSAYATSEVISRIYAGDKSVTIDDLTFDSPVDAKVAHYIVRVKSESNASVILHVDARGKFQVIGKAEKTFSVEPRSLEQHAGLHYLNDKNIDVVSLGGRAGTGKTMLALASGLNQTIEGEYSRVMVFRPLLAVGNQDLGYLPGTEEEKMAPWAGAVWDALEPIGISKNTRENITAQKQLEVLPITHIRGRTFTKSFVIIDEAQNLERNVILSILSRIGSGSKVVLCWDAAQKDNLHISRNDGVTAVVNRLREHDLFAHVTFTKSERSRLAEVASSILEDMS